MSDRITAMDIESQEFSRRMRGFDPEEVRFYLKSVAQEIERLTLENGEILEKMGVLRAESDETRSRERALQQTLVAAQSMAEELKEKARAESQLVIKEARFRADQIDPNEKCPEGGTHSLTEPRPFNLMFRTMIFYIFDISVHNRHGNFFQRIDL